MSSTISHAASLAVQLHDATQAVRALDDLLLPRNSIGVTSCRADEPVAVSVHGCTPEQLAAVELAYDEPKIHRDADDIVRYIEVHTDRVELTFFRR